MAAYFVRRLASGAVALLAMTFVLYSMLMYFPGGLLWQTQKLWESWGWDIGSLGTRAWEAENSFGSYTYKLYKSWPDSYVTWLFDSTAIYKRDLNDNTRILQKGININLGSFHLQGSGILTGDWGESHQISNGQSTLAMMGESFWLWDALSLATTLLCMVFVVFQHRGHRPVYSPPRFPFTPHDRASLTFRYTRPS